MTKDETLKLVVDLLKAVLCDSDGKCCLAGSDEDRAIIDRALEALAQPEEVPVPQVDCTYGYSQCQALEIANKKRPWVGLTKVEQDDLIAAGYDRKTLKLVESLLKGKNT